MKACFVLTTVFFYVLVGAGMCKAKETGDYFKEAVPVWVDARNVKDKAGGFVLTTAGRHQSRQAEKNLTVSFRSIIHLDNVTDATLKLAASSTYRAYLNGHFLGYGPCVAAHGFYRVDEYELRDFLKKGDNVLAIEVVGYNVYTYYTLNQPAFLQAEVLQNGHVLAATNTRSDANSFEASMLEQRVQDVPLYSFQRPHTESYMLSENYRDWRLNPKDKTYEPLKLERTAAKKLLPRGVRYPDYSVRKYERSIGDSIFKFEVNSTGFIGTKVIVHTPTKLTLSWDEILQEEDVNPRRFNSENFLHYQLEPGNYELESFEPYTLQYLKVTVNEGDCEVADPYVRQYVNSDVWGTFKSSDSKLNTIFKAAVETYKQNALDIFMDCPQRERAGWLCDSYFTSRVAFNLSGNTLIEKNFLENFLMPEKFEFIPEGMLPMCYPADHPNANYIPNWAMWYVLELEEYFKRSGDHQMVADAAPRIKALLRFYKDYENEDGLLEDLEKWVFVEWSKANSFVQGVNYPTNMLYAYMLEVAARLYAMPELSKQAERIRMTIREQAYDGVFFMDNAIRVNGRLVPQTENRTETCQYYAFFFGVADADRYPGLLGILVNDFGPERKLTKKYEEIHPSNAFIGNYLRLEILSRYGYVKQLLDESVDEYLYMANLTGTLWEHIHTRASLNHGFASHIAHVFYRDLVGIKEVDILNKKIFIVFHETALQSSDGVMPIGEGEITLSWQKNGNQIIYSCTAPNAYEIVVTNHTSYKLVLNPEK